MRCWLRLALDVVQAEWPSFEIVQTMTMFNLSAEVNGTSDAFFKDQSTSRASCIHRLAGFLKIDAVSLAAEYDKLLLTAEHEMKSGHCKCSLQAWRAAVQHFRSGGSRRGGTAWNYGAVLQALQLFACMVVSTSGLEQAFSHVQRLFGAHRCGMPPQMRNDIHELTSCSPETYDQVVATAQDVWTANYGTARAPRCQARIDIGHPRKARASCIGDIGTACAMSTFTDLRKASVRSVTKQQWALPDALAEMKAVTAEDWTERLKKEEEFNDKKFIHAGIEACQQNAALPSEVDLLHDVMAEHVQHRAKRKHERQLENARRRRCFQEPQAIDFRGKPIHIDMKELSRMVAGYGGDARRLADHVDAGGMVLKDHPLSAAGGIFVVPDPASPPQAVRLIAALAGGAIMDAKYFQTLGSQGTNVSYHAGVHVRRTIYISEAAKTASQELAEMIEVISTEHDQSNWRVVHLEPPGTSLASSFLALVDGHEKEAHPEWSGCRYAFCMADFLDYIEKLDLATSTAGLCHHGG